MKIYLMLTCALHAAAQRRHRLLQQVPTDECTRWGFIASIVCPEIASGDLRSACAACPSVMRNVQNECYSNFPGFICSGDCNTIPLQLYTCQSPSCDACWATQTSTACANCDASCFTHMHCWDAESESFSSPAPIPRETIVSDCTGLRRVYHKHDCCSSSNTVLSNTTLLLQL